MKHPAVSKGAIGKSRQLWEEEEDSQLYMYMGYISMLDRYMQWMTQNEEKTKLFEDRFFLSMHCRIHRFFVYCKYYIFLSLSFFADSTYLELCTHTSYRRGIYILLQGDKCMCVLLPFLRSFFKMQFLQYRYKKKKKKKKNTSPSSLAFFFLRCSHVDDKSNLVMTFFSSLLLLFTGL